MQEAILYIKEVGKRKNKQKLKKTFPTISREDIMAGILSTELNHLERSKLSNLYAEITHMEKKDLKYITEIAVSSESDSEIYEMLNQLNRKKEKIEEKIINQFRAKNNQSDVLKTLNLLENNKVIAAHDKEILAEFKEKYPKQLNVHLIHNYLNLKDIYSQYLNEECEKTEE